MLAVKIEGNTDFRKALRQFTPDLEKNLNDEMAAGLKPVVKRAQGYVPKESPMSGWDGGNSNKINKKTSMFRVGKFPLFSPAVIKRGIVYSTKITKRNKNGFNSLAAIYNKSAAGAIYETAGRKNPQGQDWVGPTAGGKSKKVSRSNNPTAGATFIANLPALVQSRQGEGRLIYRAWAEDLGRANNIVKKAIDKTRKEFYARNAASPFRKAA